MIERASVHASLLFVPTSTTAITVCKDHLAYHAQCTSVCNMHIFSLLMTSSQNNPLRYCTITNATTILESTTDNEEVFSLITEGRLP